jgi:hypothetical protein
MFHQCSSRVLEVRLEEVPAAPTAHTRYIRRAANVVRDRYFSSGTPPTGGRRDGRNSRRVYPDGRGLRNPVVPHGIVAHSEAAFVSRSSGCRAGPKAI